jgi:hypothetical protein
MKDGTITSKKIGEGRFAPLDFSYSDLGLPEPESQKQIAIRSAQSDEPPAGDAVAPPKTHYLDCPIEDLDDWFDDELKQGIIAWCKPADPNGPISNMPDVHSSTMPSPESFAKLQRARLLLEMRSYVGKAPAPRRQKMIYTYSR